MRRLHPLIEDAALHGGPMPPWMKYDLADVRLAAIHTEKLIHRAKAENSGEQNDESDHARRNHPNITSR